MALVTGWFKRSGTVTDEDGRQGVVELGGIADTKNITGTAAAPGATTAISAISSLTVGGIYRVEGTIHLTGTAETVLNNLRLRTNGAAIAGGGILPTISAQPVPFLIPRVPCGANGVIDVASQAAATAGSIYTIRLTVTRVE